MSAKHQCRTAVATCNTAFITSNDSHPHCEASLSAEHAELAISLWAACPFCAYLPEAKKQQGLGDHAAACLHMLQIPEQIQKSLLDGPISHNGLFGPCLQEAVSEEAHITGLGAPSASSG